MARSRSSELCSNVGSSATASWPPNGSAQTAAAAARSRYSLNPKRPERARFYANMLRSARQGDVSSINPPVQQLVSQGSDIVANAMTKKSQIVQIDATDTAFKTSGCQQWQPSDCMPGCAPTPANPIDVLSQIGRLFGPGTPTTDLIDYIREWFAEREEKLGQEA